MRKANWEYLLLRTGIVQNAQYTSMSMLSHDCGTGLHQLEERDFCHEAIGGDGLELRLQHLRDERYRLACLFRNGGSKIK